MSPPFRGGAASPEPHRTKSGAKTTVSIVDIETIRQELEFYTGRFPADAVRAAIEQREAVTPVLLDALQKVAEDPEAMEREPDFIWSALVVACCDLYPEELVHDIERAYDDGLVDLFHIRLESVRDKLALSKEDWPQRSLSLRQREEVQEMLFTVTGCHLASASFRTGYSQS